MCLQRSLRFPFARKNLLITNIYFEIVDQFSRRRSTRTFNCVYRLELTKRRKKRRRRKKEEEDMRKPNRCDSREEKRTIKRKKQDR
jgi:hypothetical protein